MCSTLNWDTFPPAKKKKKKNSLLHFFGGFFFKPPNHENCQGITRSWFIPKTVLCFLFFFLLSFFFFLFQMNVPFHFRREKQHSAHCVSVIAVRRRAFHAMLLTYLCYSCTFSACLDCLIFCPKVLCRVLCRCLSMAVIQSSTFFFPSCFFFVLFCFCFTHEYQRGATRTTGILKPSLRREQVQI